MVGECLTTEAFVAHLAVNNYLLALLAVTLVFQLAERFSAARTLQLSQLTRIFMCCQILLIDLMATPLTDTWFKSALAVVLVKLSHLQSTLTTCILTCDSPFLANLCMVEKVLLFKIFFAMFATLQKMGAGLLMICEQSSLAAMLAILILAL